MADPLTATLRTGTRNPQALYAQLGDAPAGTDPSIGWAKTPEIARAACAAVNDHTPVQGPRWWRSEGLIYAGPAALLTRNWIIALDPPELAQRIVMATRGEEACA